MNAAECHDQAGREMGRAIKHLRAAFHLEDGLEWSHRIGELLHEAEYVAERLRAYAEAAKGEGARR